jgi:hypothetical protein
MSRYSDIAPRAHIAQPVETSPGLWDMFLNRSKKLGANAAAFSGACMMASGFLPAMFIAFHTVADAIARGGMPYFNPPSQAIVIGAAGVGCTLVGLLGTKMLQHFQVRLHQLNKEYRHMKAARRPAQPVTGSTQPPEMQP